MKGEGGWLVATSCKGMSGSVLDRKRYRDVAMRGRVRGRLYLNLRNDREPADYYSARSLGDGTGNITLVSNGAVHREIALVQFHMNIGVPADPATKERAGLRMGKIASIKTWGPRSRVHQGNLADVALRASMIPRSVSCFNRSCPQAAAMS